MICAHPLRPKEPEQSAPFAGKSFAGHMYALAGKPYSFSVPLLEGEHVTEDTGTGFVHTAPSHGVDDFEVWIANARYLQSLGIDPTVPDIVGPDGYLPEVRGPVRRRRSEARHRRQGPFRQARRSALCKRGGDRGAEGGGCACGHEPAPQARLRPFLAVQSAGHLSQHAAMVHRHGQAGRCEGLERKGEPAGARRQSDR